MLRVLVTSDIHFETLEKDNMRNYIQYFKESIERIKPDMFVIAGDTTDSQYLRMGSEETLWLNKFLIETADVCCKCGVYYTILRGTPSHDGWNVPNLVSVGDSILNSIIDLKDKICTSYMKGKTVLFIPETYLPTYADFDKEIAETGVSESNKADLIVFHGMFDFAIEQLKQKDSSHGLNRSIIMNSDKIGRLTKSCAIGGHFHAFLVHDNIVYTDRFINTRGHWSSDSHLFGIKLLTIDDDYSWRVENIDNPYLIKQDQIHLDFVNMTEIELIDISKEYNGRQNDIIYHCYLNSEPVTRQKFSAWMEVIQPKYIHKINRDSDGKIIRATTKAESIELDETNLKTLVSDVYYRKYGENDKDVVDQVYKEICSSDDEC